MRNEVRIGERERESGRAVTEVHFSVVRRRRTTAAAAAAAEKVCGIAIVCYLHRG